MTLAYKRLFRALGGQIVTAASPGDGNGTGHSGKSIIRVPKDKGCEKWHRCMECIYPVEECPTFMPRQVPKHYKKKEGQLH
jgi:hypothetical protein